MKRQAILRIHSLIQHPGDKPMIDQQQLNATWIQKVTTDYIQYKETREGQEVRTTVKVTDEEVLILRGGDIDMRLPLKAHTTQRGTYRNEPLVWAMMVEAEDVTIERSEEKNKWRATYRLHIGEEEIGKYTLTMTYTEGTL